MTDQPHSTEAECGILGACLMDAETCLTICADMEITPESFYIPQHRALYRELAAMKEAGKRMDLLLITQHLRDHGAIEEAGGMLYVEGLVDKAIVSHCQAYADVVAEKHLARRIIERCARAVEEVQHTATKPDAIHASLQADLSRMMVEVDARPLHEVGVQLVDRWRNTKDEDTAIRWPLEGLHRKFGHLTDEFAVIMAAPSVGKTAFSLQMALHLARHGVPCGYLSLESSVEKVCQRLIAMHAPVDTLKLRRGNDHSRNYDNAAKAAESFKELPLRVISKPMTVEQIRAWAMMEKRNGARCLFIDNLKHIRSAKAFKNRFDEFAHFSISLKFIRDDIGIPLVVLHHTNNEGQAAWSSDIRRDVDVLVCMTRDETRVGENVEHVDWQMLKQREGATGVAQLRFEKDIQTFFEMRADDPMH